jgi:hypothetical protein
VFLDLLCLPEMVSVVRRDDAQPVPTRTRLSLKNAVWNVGCSKPFFRRDTLQQDIRSAV